MAKTTEQRELKTLPKQEVIDALLAYKRQNPAKFEAKKEALFARYGIELGTPIEEKPLDETEVLLTKAKSKLNKKDEQ